MPISLRVSRRVDPAVGQLVADLSRKLPQIIGGDALRIYVSHLPHVDGVPGYITDLRRRSVPRIVLAGGAPPHVAALYGVSARAALADVAFTLLHEVGHYTQYRDGASTRDERDADRRAARYLRRLHPALHRIYRVSGLSTARQSQI